MRNLDGPDPSAPLALWPHQQEDVRDTSPLIIHQDGRAVGKTVNVTVLVCHFGVTQSNGRMLVTTPNEGHLMKIIEEVEEQVFGSDFLMEQIAIDPRSGRHLITRKPYYQIRWKSGTIQYFRPAGSAGKSVRSLHCSDILMDEAAWYPEAGWRALRRVLNPGGRMRAYTNPNGLRDTTYYRLTTDPKAGAKVVKWPSWIRPDWSEEDTEREAKFYGGRDTPGMREFGLLGTGDGLDESFPEIHELSLACRFADCTHTDEPGCAVLEAARQDEISEARCQSYLKLSKENEVHDMSYVEKRRKDKDFGRFIKAHKKGGER
jgi:hypothetical protein